MVDIKGLDKAKVLKALYDGSHIQGLGILQAISDFTLDNARNCLSKTSDFDYLYRRVLKVNLSGDSFDERLYDRDNGKGAAQRAISKIA